MTDFAVVFEALTGHSPMLWQTRLFEEIVEGRLPSALDLPTGLGKTSVIAIWLAARAVGANLPRRLVYVVDRRAVVDQATTIADSIARTIGDGTQDSRIVQELRAGLGLPPGRALPVSTLRGQHVDNREWLEDPSLPAIVVGTVDMIGSRLLFQGYGVSAGMRPVHAALLGADTLAVLDEAHLVPPFEHLLRSVTHWPRAEGVPAFRFLSLSATGRTEGMNPFRLIASDMEDEQTAARLQASKRVQVRRTTGDLAEALAQAALERGVGSSRVIVFCDSRRVAQKVADRLATLLKGKFGKAAELPALLVGGRRIWERSKYDPAFVRFRPKARAADAPEELPTTPAFLVATSAGEVGVDLDADHLVMDLVPWERMVQRLGRVNRRPEPGQSLVDVFVAEPDKDAESGAGKSADDMQAWLAPFESPVWALDADGRHEASPFSLLRLRDDSAFAMLTGAASTREPYYPELSPPVLDALAMTSVKEHPGRPDVAPWLRGWIDEEPQTRLAWRRLLPVRDGDIVGGEVTRSVLKHVEAFFVSAPPHLSEIVEVPTSQAVELLRKRIAAWPKKLSSDEQESSSDRRLPPVLVILNVRNEVEDARFVTHLKQLDAKALARLLVGKTVVVDAELGGLDENGLLDGKFGDPPSTADGTSSAAAAWAATIGVRVLRGPRQSESERGYDSWLIEYRLDLSAEGDEEGEEIRVEVLRSKAATRGDAAIARVEQSLSKHHEMTADAAKRIGKSLELPDSHVDMLVAAAAVHDAGKARDLWQNAMRASKVGRPYAKTRGGGDFRVLQLNGMTYRHEFGSIADAEQSVAIQGLSADLRDLALHLVAAHHGHGRPLIAPVDPDAPPSVTVERAQAVAWRFYRMQQTWGPWGLAWWEALLRAADWSASRAVNEGEAAKP